MILALQVLFSISGSVLIDVQYPDKIIVLLTAIQNVSSLVTILTLMTSLINNLIDVIRNLAIFQVNHLISIMLYIVL